MKYDTPIPDYADVMTVEDFRSACIVTAFVDSDGTGYYAVPPNMSEVTARPSEVKKGLRQDGSTHIAWFNK